jgi:hypothetical protein
MGFHILRQGWGFIFEVSVIQWLGHSTTCESYSMTQASVRTSSVTLSISVLDYHYYKSFVRGPTVYVQI